MVTCDQQEKVLSSQNVILWIFLEIRYSIWRYAELNHLLIGSSLIPLNIELKQDDRNVCCNHKIAIKMSAYPGTGMLPIAAPTSCFQCELWNEKNIFSRTSCMSFNMKSKGTSCFSSFSSYCFCRYCSQSWCNMLVNKPFTSNVTNIVLDLIILLLFIFSIILKKGGGCPEYMYHAQLPFLSHDIPHKLISLRLMTHIHWWLALQEEFIFIVILWTLKLQ